VPGFQHGGQLRSHVSAQYPSRSHWGSMASRTAHRGCIFGLHLGKICLDLLVSAKCVWYHPSAGSALPSAVDFRAVFVPGKSTACGASKTAGRQGGRAGNVSAVARWVVWTGRLYFPRPNSSRGWIVTAWALGGLSWAMNGLYLDHSLRSASPSCSIAPFHSRASSC
jgi:hypothetical protein